MPDIGSTSDHDSDLVPVLEPNERIKQLSLSAKVPYENSVPIKRYWRSGKELLRMANVYKEEQELAKAFLLHMKYITLFVEKIPQHPEYKTSDPNERALTKTNCKQLFPIAEQLKSQLKERYQKEYDLYLEQKKKRQLEEEKRSEKEKQEIARRREEQKEKELKELQFKLNKQIEEQRERPENPEALAASNWQNDVNDQTSFDLIPLIDRTKKPSNISKFSLLSRVIVPQKVIEKFLASARGNTTKNVETCAILAGKLGQNAFTITHVIVPKQRGTSDSCQTENEEEMFMIQDNYELLTIGWIHTHPTQDAFMSSIDLHTHCSYQLMLPEAIAIVCAPKKEEVGVFSLTSPYGLELIASCRLSGFHPHPTQPPIYEKSSHISFDTMADIELIDLR